MFETLKSILVEELQLDPDDIKMESELANDLGNLVQRLATLAQKNGFVIGETAKNEKETQLSNKILPREYCELMEKFEFSKAFDFVWEKIQGLNRKIDEEKPWSLAKNGETEKLKECLRGLIVGLLEANQMLMPFLPNATEKIETIFVDPIVPPETPLFPKS